MPERDLQIEEDLQFQERAWVVQRVGWGVMLLLVVATIAGVFGEGALSSATVGDAKQLKIEHERFVHYLTPTVLKIHVRAGPEDKKLQVRINSGFMQAVKVDNVVPQPASVETGDQWLSYNFTVETPGQVTIRIDLTPETIGRLSATINSGHGEPLSFRQFVYP